MCRCIGNATMRRGAFNGVDHLNCSLLEHQVVKMASTAEKKRAQAEEGEEHASKPSSEEVPKRQRRSTGEGENDAANEQGGEGVRQKQGGGGDAGDPPTASGVIEEGAIEFFYRWITQAWWCYVVWMPSMCPIQQYSRESSQFLHLPRLCVMHARPPVQHHANKELSLPPNCRRPKVGVEEANSLNEVQRFFMLLRPRKPGGTKNRLCVIGKKRMPSARKHEVRRGGAPRTADRRSEVGSSPATIATTALTSCQLR